MTSPSTMLRRIPGAAMVMVVAMGSSSCRGLPDEVDDPTEQAAESSADADIPIDCGNRIVDPGEECDDGDDDPLDGCLVDCRAGPRALVTGMPFATSQHGTLDAGNPVEDACPQWQAIVALRGDQDPQGGWLRRLQAVCGRMELVLREDGGFAVHLGEGEMLPVRGTGTGPADGIARCPPDHVAVGFSGRTGSVVDQLVLQCAPIYVYENEIGRFEVALGDPVDSEPLGGEGGGMFGPVECGGGAIATMVRLRIGDAVHAFGLGCGVLALQIGPPP